MHEAKAIGLSVPSSILCDITAPMPYAETLSPSNDVLPAVGDGCRDSNDHNEVSSSVKTDTVAGTFKQHRKLQWSMEFRLCVYLLSMVILFAIGLLHVFVDT